MIEFEVDSLVNDGHTYAAFNMLEPRRVRAGWLDGYWQEQLKQARRDLGLDQ